jgi:hypothetical protein
MCERGIDKCVGGVVDLALGEWPQLDDLHPAWKRVGELAQREDLG